MCCRWLWRHRIRIALQGTNAWEDPVELHEQQLLYPEHRWLDHIAEDRLATTSRHSRPGSLRHHGTSDKSDGTTDHPPLATQQSRRVLPVLALNEVFMGESVSSRSVAPRSSNMT